MTDDFEEARRIQERIYGPESEVPVADVAGLVLFILLLIALAFGLIWLIAFISRFLWW